MPGAGALLPGGSQSASPAAVQSEVLLSLDVWSSKS